MVDGHEIVTPAPGGQLCAVVDLDGTLLRGNSLRMFIRFLVRKLHAGGNYRHIASIFRLLALRRLRLISHVAMKFPIHRLASELLTEAEIDEFVSSLLPSLNGGLLAELTRMRESGWRVMLATAAPDVYVGRLNEILGFDAWTATPLSRTVGEYVENRGAVKRDRAVSEARRRGWTLGAVATDHEDDLPLLSLSPIRRLLVDSTPRLRVALQRASLPFEQINDGTAWL
ncbi:MAG: haloacid dehalogenase-like hydrolase [Bacteroides sp.]|nr:haloacid dehalogenase-like hydrolase [Bacteroides sp.]